jgi:putative Ca2+/H+ antiporter (TMEM165/GDT1 family)
VKLDSIPNNLIDSPQSQIQPELDPPAVVTTTQDGVANGTSKRAESVFVTFGTTFITIFFAEIGDKTQLSTLLMSAQSHQPWVVFLGSAAALVTTSFLGVALGSWISTKLSPRTVEKSAGVMLLFVAVMLFWDVVQG